MMILIIMELIIYVNAIFILVIFISSIIYYWQLIAS